MDIQSKKDIEKWRDYFTFNIADEAHSKISTKEKKRPEQLLTELTESDEY